MRMEDLGIMTADHHGVKTRKAYAIGGFLTMGDQVTIEDDGDHRPIIKNLDGSIYKPGNTLELFQYYDPIELVVVDHDGIMYDENTPYDSDSARSWSHVVDVIMNGFRYARGNAGNIDQWPEEDTIDYEIRSGSKKVLRDHGVRTLMIYLSKIAEDIDYWRTCSSFETLAFNDDNLIGNTILDLIHGGDSLEIISNVDMTPNDIRIVYDLPVDDEEKREIISSDKPWRVIAGQLDEAGLPITAWLPYLRMEAILGRVRPEFVRTLTGLLKNPSKSGLALLWKIIDHRQDVHGEKLRMLLKRMVCTEDDPELAAAGVRPYRLSGDSIPTLLLECIECYYAGSDSRWRDDYGVNGYHVSVKDVDWFNNAGVDDVIDEIVTVFGWLADRDESGQISIPSDVDLDEVISKAGQYGGELVDAGPRPDVPMIDRFMTVNLSNVSLLNAIRECIDKDKIG